MNAIRNHPSPFLQSTAPARHRFRGSIPAQRGCWLVLLLSTVLLLSSACAGLAAHSFTGKLSFFTVPEPYLIRGKIVLGPDGNLWFTTVAYDHFGTDQPSGEIGRITPDGKLTMFPMPSANSWPSDIIAGPDGNLWFLAIQGSGKVVYGVDTPPGFEYAYDEIGKLTPSGKFSFLPLPPDVYAGRITVGPDHNVWFTEEINGPPTYDVTNKIVRVTPGGSFTEFTLQTLQPHDLVSTLVAGPDGNLWFGINSMLPDYSAFGEMGRMTMQGAVKVFTLGKFIEDDDLTVGPDNNLWFTGNPDIARFTTDGKLHMFSAPGASNNPLGSGGSGIAAGEDGLWYVAGLSAIRRVSTDGQFTSYPIPASAGLTDHPGQFQFRGITTGADGAIWFIAANEIGHLV